jgi:valyl-tRNA synthetase
MNQANEATKKELPKAYEPATVENDIYALWQQSGAFQPTDNPDAKPFTIIAPPPNANGALHIGHAVGATLQDLMIRYHRMKGEAALWLPGFDHAGFETQVVYEKKLDKEGRSRFDIPRDQLYQEMYEFTQSNIETNRNQFRKLGVSMDWSREMFTIDPRVVSIVYKTFKQLYDDGLVYRGERPINWCTRHQTGLADLETKFEEREDQFYYFKYGPFTIGTSRPETKFGDKYVVMHPDDDRYKEYKDGQQFEAEWINGPITATVIKDEAIDMQFGTGVMTITPWHDATDFEIAKRHNLDMEQIIDKRGKLLPIAGEFEGLHISKARPLIVEKLKEKGLLEKVNEKYVHSIQTCYKCGTVIEPQIMPQWFIAMTKTGKSGKNLRDDAVAAVRDGRVTFVTKKFENTFHSWLGELRDWNISHQIVWGIQLPIWYCQCKPDCQCDPIITDGSTPEKCPSCGSDTLERDPDVFNTWFSSGQWPFAALQANSEDDLKRFYPTTVMETAYDILFFWVARMIMLGLYTTDQVPFSHVYLHGLVRDKDRQKMSKSKNNVLDPLGVAEQYGSDAVRLALVFGTSAGNDIVVSEDKIRGMRNFANKLWNISRFTMMHTEDFAATEEKLVQPEGKTDIDREFLGKLDQLVVETTKLIDDYQFHIVAEKLYDFIWHELADKYIEAAKGQLEGETRESTQTILLFSLVTLLKLLHPIMPFVTEAIYQSLPITGKSSLLMTASWPEPRK